MFKSHRFLLTLCACYLLAAGAVALLVSHQHYHRQLTRVVEVVLAKTENRAALQHALYTKDKKKLNGFVDQLLAEPEVSGVTIYDTNADVVAVGGQKGARGASLDSLRGAADLLATTLTTVGDGGAQASSGFWSAVFGDGALHLTVPVIFTVNQTGRGLTANDFLSSDIDQSTGSRNVLGYVHAALDTSRVMAGARGHILQIVGLMTMVALMLVALFYHHLGRIRGALAELDQLAEEVGAGKPVETLTVPEDPETRRVAEAIKGLIQQVKESRYDAESGRKILGRKENESASKLSEQDNQLSRAADEIVAAKKELHKVTFYDGLTSLPNRALFQDHLQLLLNSSERGGKSVALLFMNLNNFGRVNDSFGYSVGDLVLTEIANRLKQCLRRNDVVSSNTGEQLNADISRVGGDEFALVLDQLDKAESASIVAQRIIDQVTAPMDVAGQEIIVSPSIGIAIAPRDARDVDGITRAARLAMNNVPLNPNGSFLFYHGDLARDEEGLFRLEAELRKAAEREQLQMYYQPQVDTADGSIAGAEALMRWTHPEFGEVPPSRFIPLAKQAGMMPTLGNWGLREACRQLKEFRSGGLELPRVAINISPEELVPELAARVQEALEDFDLSPDSLELGLSEIVIMQNTSDESKTLRQLSELGVHLTLDNFGISSTPLSHLSLCPIDELKMDYQVVHNCDHNPRNASLAKAVIAVAKSLELRIVAAGVETRGEYSFLVGNGARMLQGFLFSEPVTADEFRRLLEVPWPYMSQIQAFKLAESRDDA